MGSSEEEETLLLAAMTLAVGILLLRRHRKQKQRSLTWRRAPEGRRPQLFQASISYTRFEWDLNTWRGGKEALVKHWLW